MAHGQGSRGRAGDGDQRRADRSGRAIGGGFPHHDLRHPGRHQGQPERQPGLRRADLGRGRGAGLPGAGGGGPPGTALHRRGVLSWCAYGFPGDPRARFTDTAVFPSGLGTSKGLAQVAATGSTVFDIAKWNGSSWSNVGTATFAPAGTVATFAMGSGQTFSAGDAMRITGPASADATIADVTFSIRGTR